MRQKILFACITALLFAKPAHAVPPPDFIFNLGSQLVYVFSAAAVIFSAIFSISYQYIKVRLHSLTKKAILITTMILFIGFISLGATYAYSQYKLRVEYEKWLIESEEQAELEVEEEEEPIEEDQEGYERPEDNQFWEENQSAAISISNDAFKVAVDSGEDNYVILDTRENIENEYGYMPGSTHIRYADLFNGDWDELPEDKFVYVLCWSGIRGLEIAEFLREQELVGIYLSDGVDAWVESGGDWVGGIKFLDVYVGDHYSIVFSTEEVQSHVNEGVILVDAREPNKFQSTSQSYINIPLMHTPSSELEDAFAQVPAGSTVITICDEYTNCFMAKLVGVELERRGHTFLGRYNRPWNY